MVRIEHELTIERSPSDVFAYLIDIARAPEWQATALEAHLESERMENGARMVEVRKLLGRHMETTLEVVEFEPDRGFAVKVVSGPLKFRASYHLEPANGSTKLQFVLEGDPERFFRFDEPAVEEQFRNQVKDDFRSLKIRLETGAASLTAAGGAGCARPPPPAARAARAPARAAR